MLANGTCPRVRQNISALFQPHIYAYTVPARRRSEPYFILFLRSFALLLLELRLTRFLIISFNATRSRNTWGFVVVTSENGAGLH